MSIFSELVTPARFGVYCARINLYGKNANKLQKDWGLKVVKSEIQDPSRKNGMKTYVVSWEHAVSEMPQNETEIKRLPAAQQLWLISTIARKKSN